MRLLAIRSGRTIGDGLTGLDMLSLIHHRTLVEARALVLTLELQQFVRIDRAVLIRADKRARHEDVKRIMDICTQNGVWKVGFVAMVRKAAE